MVHIYQHQPDSFEPIGKDGNVSCNWPDFGVSFPFPMCSNCESPPFAYGVNASRCKCCAPDIPTCEEWYDIGGNSVGGCNAEQDTTDDWNGGCSGNRSEWGSTNVTRVGGGEVGVITVQRISPNQNYKINWDYRMEWTCGLIKDIVRGKCNQFDPGYVPDPDNPCACGGFAVPDDGCPPLLPIPYDGVCASSLSETSVNIITAGIHDSSDNYYCPCNCGDASSALFGCCDIKATHEWLFDGPCGQYAYMQNEPDDVFERHFAQMPIKGDPNHSVGRDSVEITGEIDSGGGGSCECSAPENVHACNEPGCHMYRGSVLLYQHRNCNSELQGDDQAMYDRDHCTETNCEECEGECGPCNGAFVSVFPPDINGCGQVRSDCTYPCAAGNFINDAAGSPGGCSAWACAKNRGCGAGSAIDGSWNTIHDPVIVPAGACALVLRVEVQGQAGNCRTGGPGGNEFPCNSGCGDDDSRPQPCGWATASVSAGVFSGPPPDNGACCIPADQEFPEIRCYAQRTENQCNQLDGEWQGAETECETCTCKPSGACCRGPGDCSIECEDSCLDDGGIYQGDNTTCVTWPDPPPHTCG